MPSLLILTEHGLTSSNLTNTNIPGYSLLTEFSREEHKLGGVAILKNDSTDIKTVNIDVSNHCTQFVCEAAMISVKCDNHLFYLLGIYRSPGGRAEYAIEAISNILDLVQSKSVIVMGDINIDRLDRDHIDTRMLEEQLLTHNIKRLPLPATRITSTTATSIDCICTNLEEESIQFMVFETGISDHTAQTLTLNNMTGGKVTPLSMYKRNYTQQNLVSLKEILVQEDWTCVYNCQDADKSYDIFQRIIRRALEEICPKKKSRPKNSTKHKIYPDQLANQLKQDYLEALNKFKTSGMLEDKINMTTKKKNYDLYLRQLRQKMTAEYIDSADNKSRALWHVINSERKNKQQDTAPVTININGKSEKQPQQLASYFNFFFSEMAEKTLKTTQNPNFPALQHTTTTQNQFHFTQIHPITIIDAISSLKPSLSCGLDEIPAKLVKYCAHEIAMPLTNIINKSFLQGNFPSSLKHSKIFPKYKSGPKTDVTNFRPISNISTFAKIFEKIVLSQLMSHLKHNELITDSQHGFLKGKSTTSALIAIIEYIIDQLEESNYVSAILIDYSKAFDCLGHELILHKLKSLGISYPELGWFRSYLTGRTQRVEVQQVINNTKTSAISQPLPTKRGVPQGSVLGPVLFILLTNDFPDTLNTYTDAKCVMYADDTTLIVKNKSAKDLSENLTKTLNNAIEYSNKNDLKINPDKSILLNFSRRREPVPTISNIRLEQEAKLLGMTIDSDLSWTSHINNLCSKLGSGIYLTRRIRILGGLTTARTAYYALVESHIRYGLALWGGTTEGNLNRVLLLQKRAIRILANLQPRDSCREAFKNLKIRTVVALYIEAVLLSVDDLDLPRHEDIHSYNTRQARNYYLPTHRTTLYTKKPTYIGQHLYNCLPNHLKVLRGKTLKNQLQQWLENNPFYNLKEFFEAARK